MFQHRRYLSNSDFVFMLILMIFLASHARKVRSKSKNDIRIKVKHDYKKHVKYNKAAVNNYKAPQLTKRDREYLSRLEDALQNKNGGMMFTNSWAVQLNPAEVAQADKIAKKHGFENLGQVSLFLIYTFYKLYC